MLYTAMRQSHRWRASVRPTSARSALPPSCFGHIDSVSKPMFVSRCGPARRRRFLEGIPARPKSLARASPAVSKPAPSHFQVALHRRALRFVGAGHSFQGIENRLRRATGRHARDFLPLLLAVLPPPRNFFPLGLDKKNSFSEKVEKWLQLGGKLAVRVSRKLCRPAAASALIGRRAGTERGTSAWPALPWQRS
jgi:hypothetical protein